MESEPGCDRAGSAGLGGLARLRRAQVGAWADQHGHRRGFSPALRHRFRGWHHIVHALDHRSSLAPPARGLPPVAGRLRAFTLIELLSVIAVVGVLAAVLAPVVGKVRAAARATVCGSNMRQLGVAFTLRAEENRGRLPAPKPAADTYWFTELHRYCGSRAPVAAEGFLGDRVHRVFLCPEWSVEHATIASFEELGYAMCANLRPSAIAPEPAREVALMEIREPARKLLLIEYGAETTFMNNLAWGTGYLEAEGTVEQFAGSGRHDTSANYLFADGHVRRMSPIEARAFFADPATP